jgi:hypothetical protein
LTGPSGFFPHLVLALWVPISILAFFLMRPERAAIFVVLGAAMFLPEIGGGETRMTFFRFPFVPELDKDNVPYLCILLGLLLRAPGRLRNRPKERWFALLMLVLVVGAFGTALTNPDTLQYGKYRIRTIPGLNFKDGAYMAFETVLRVGIPFFVGACLFRTPKSLRDLLAGFAMGGLFYIPFALVEIRMSPQLHNWIYGYHQHSFDQTLRWGGYRPMVFMAHGLALARFFVVAFVGALLIASKRKRILGLPSRLVAALLLITIVLCKSTGGILYAVAALPIVAFGGVRFRQTVAVVLTSVVLLYPILRGANLFPISEMLEAAGQVAADREQSLLFRFQNEDQLLVKARERIFFGWGEYGRNANYDELARPASVTDGHWIVLMTCYGAVGFVAAFGILLIPVFLARRRLRTFRDADDAALIAGISFLIAVIGVDLLPNGMWSSYPYLLAGALTGATRAILQAQKKAGPEDALVLRSPLQGAAAL